PPPAQPARRRVRHATGLLGETVHVELGPPPRRLACELLSIARSVWSLRTSRRCASARSALLGKGSVSSRGSIVTELRLLQVVAPKVGREPRDRDGFEGRSRSVIASCCLLTQEQR